MAHDSSLEDSTLVQGHDEKGTTIFVSKSSLRKGTTSLGTRTKIRHTFQISNPHQCRGNTDTLSEITNVTFGVK